jgi:hypothetical protein
MPSRHRRTLSQDAPIMVESTAGQHTAIRHPYPETLKLSLSATGWTIAFTECPDVVGGLEAILHGWGLRRIARGAPDAEITRICEGYVWESAERPKPVMWDRKPPGTAMNVISDVHDVMFDWFLADHPDLLCLHAGAVDLGRGLLCFPSVGRAGKSTLCVALTERGHHFYCDDVLPIDPQSLSGIAMGIAPLLRKPLPRTLGKKLARFIAERKGPSSRYWTYLRLSRREIAPHGDRKPILALVLLERRKSSQAELFPVRKSEMLKEAILQNFGARATPGMILDNLAKLIESRDCYRLIYDDVNEAADLLGARFT